TSQQTKASHALRFCVFLTASAFLAESYPKKELHLFWDSFHAEARLLDGWMRSAYICFDSGLLNPIEILSLLNIVAMIEGEREAIYSFSLFKNLAIVFPANFQQAVTLMQDLLSYKKNHATALLKEIAAVSMSLKKGAKPFGPENVAWLLYDRAVAL